MKIENDNKIDNQSKKANQTLKIIQLLAVIGGSLLATAYIAFSTYQIWTDEIIRGVVRDHFMAIIGLPSAGIAALCIVLILESTSGPISCDILGFRFKGASGPIVFWVICFLAITLAIKICW